MNEKNPEQSAGTGVNFSGFRSGEFSWGISLLLKFLVLGIGGVFIYWTGWPQPDKSIHPAPSTAESEVLASSRIELNSPGSLPAPAGNSPARRTVASQPPQAGTNEQKGQSRNIKSVVVDLNNGTPAEFEHLPGIGSVLAGRIVAHRTSHGAFRRVEDLMLVPGIGEKRLQQLRPYVGVREQSL